jgi:hypothetical protein
MAQNKSDFPVPALSFLTHRNLCYAAAATSFLAAAQFLGTPEKIYGSLTVPAIGSTRAIEHYIRGQGILYVGIGLNSLVNADVTDPRSQRLIARGKALASAVVLANLLYSASRDEMKNEIVMSAAAVTGLFTLLWGLRGWGTA